MAPSPMYESYHRGHVDPNLVSSHPLPTTHPSIVSPSSFSLHYPLGSSIAPAVAFGPPNPLPRSPMPLPRSMHHPAPPQSSIIANPSSTSTTSFIWPASPPKAIAPFSTASIPSSSSAVAAAASTSAPQPAAAAATTTTAKSARGAGGAAARRKQGGSAAGAAAAAAATLLLAPDYTANPAGPASSSDTDFKCSYCDKVYKGKHARSIWRRHLQDKHGIPLASQPRRTRWDNDANRPKSEEERRARTLDSKRRWARKNRAGDSRSSAGGTPGRGDTVSFDGRDEGEWEEDQLDDDDGDSNGEGRSRSRSTSVKAWRDNKDGIVRSGSVPMLGRSGGLQDEKPSERSGLRTSQSSTLVAYPSGQDSRHPLLHRDPNSNGAASNSAPSHHLPHVLASPSSYYQAPLAAVVPTGGALSAPLFPSAGEAEYYRGEGATSIHQRMGSLIARPSSASALPAPYGPTQSTSSASLAYYASRASPGRGSRTALRREPKSPVRAETNTEDAAGVLLALKMASPSTSSVVQSPVSATRSRRYDDDSDDDEEEDEDAGDLSLEANEPFSAFAAKQAGRRAGGSRLVSNGRGAAIASPSREPPSSPGSSGSSGDGWSRHDGEASASTLVGSTSSTQLGKKRSAEDSPPYGGAAVLAGLSASARKMRPMAGGIVANGGRALGPGSSYHQYTSLTATPTPAMRITMESSPALGMGRDLLEGGSIGRGPARRDHDDDDGDLEEDEPGSIRRGDRARRHMNDGSPSRGMRSVRNGNGPIDDSSSSVPRANHHHPYAHVYSSSASSARHYAPQALHHHHPVGLTSDLGHFNLASSSDPSHPSSSSSIPPHPSSSSASFHLSTPGGVSNDYYRLRGSSPPSHLGGGGGYLFSSPAHPGISKQLGLHAQPGPGVLFGGDTPGRAPPVDTMESRSKGMRLVEEGGSRAVLKLEDD